MSVTIRFRLPSANKGRTFGLRRSSLGIRSILSRKRAMRKTSNLSTSAMRSDAELYCELIRARIDTAKEFLSSPRETLLRITGNDATAIRGYSQNSGTANLRRPMNCFKVPPRKRAFPLPHCGLAKQQIALVKRTSGQQMKLRAQKLNQPWMVQLPSGRRVTRRKSVNNE